MELKSFEHVLIIAKDLEATKNFYVDIVGLSVGKRPDFGFPGYWLYLGDTPCVHLGSHLRGVREATGRPADFVPAMISPRQSVWISPER